MPGPKFPIPDSWFRSRGYDGICSEVGRRSNGSIERLFSQWSTGHPTNKQGVASIRMLSRVRLKDSQWMSMISSEFAADSAIGVRELAATSPASNARALTIPGSKGFLLDFA